MADNYEELQRQYQEVAAERDRLIKQAEETRVAYLNAKQAKVEKRIADMSQEEKDYIIAHTEHGCTSCSDENPCNGLYSAHNGGYRCPKCMLMEILNGEHGGKYDFKLHFDIYEVTV